LDVGKKEPVGRSDHVKATKYAFKISNFGLGKAFFVGKMPKI